MIPPAVAAFAARWWPLAAAALATAALLALAYCEGKGAGTAAADTARLEANAELLETDREIRAARDEERRADDARLATEKDELDEIRATAPNDSLRRVARGCAILRDQGTADADLPAGCRPQGG